MLFSTANLQRRWALWLLLVMLVLSMLSTLVWLAGRYEVSQVQGRTERDAADAVSDIRSGLNRNAQTLQTLRAKQDLQHNLADLTDRERDVMHLVVEGLPNKLIADQLDISVRTVEVHRARVFDKMNVKSAVELANLLRSE
mgnify:CR=1 FL=1